MRLWFAVFFSFIILFACAAFAETEIDLSGDWDYCLINSLQDYPSLNNVTWEKVRLPNRDLFNIIARKHNITKGYILYRKTAAIQGIPSERLVFQAGEIMNTDIVFINGRKIGQTGIFPPEFKSGWSKFRNYMIPDEYLVTGENRIDVLNYFDAELWFISPIRIIDEARGNYKYMIVNLLQVDCIHAFFWILMSFSLLFVSIYVKRKKEIMYLYYSIATFFLADMTILQFVENLYVYTHLSSNTIYKICGYGPMFFPPFLAFFFRSYYGMKVSWKRIAAYLFIPCIFAALMTVSRDRYYIVMWRNLFLFMIPLYITEIAIVSIRQLIAGNKKGLLLFIVLLPVFVFGLYDIMVFGLHFFEGSVPLYPLGAPFMIILIGLQLVNRFIFNLNTSEQLNILLQEKMEEGKRLARLENEIAIARKIQLASIPETLPEQQGFHICAKYIPAENISGDFYNIHAFEHEKLGVLVADVSGHGVPASLISSMVKILFNTLAPVYSDPVAFIRGLNGYLFKNMDGNILTAGYCYIDKQRNKVKYARAGHEPLLHLSYKNRETALHEYRPAGKVIGLTEAADLELLEFDIWSGDRLVLYTDGLVEVFNERKEIFGYDRFKSLVMRSAELAVDSSVEFIYNELHEWRSFRSFDDDFTLIIIEIL